MIEEKKFYNVKCDRCGCDAAVYLENLSPNLTKKEAYKEARENNFVRLDGNDYCDKCYYKDKQKKIIVKREDYNCFQDAEKILTKHFNKKDTFLSYYEDDITKKYRVHIDENAEGYFLEGDALVSILPDSLILSLKKSIKEFFRLNYYLIGDRHLMYRICIPHEPLIDYDIEDLTKYFKKE